jgi:hypothetical protein
MDIQCLAHSPGYEKHRKLRAIHIQNHEVCNFKTRERGTDLRRFGDIDIQSLAHSSDYEKHRKLHAFHIQNYGMCNFKTSAFRLIKSTAQ